MTKTKIIADITSNHMGNLDIAKAMVEAAARAGVDIVKFQSWRAHALRKDFPEYDATYQRHRRTELSDADHSELLSFCAMHGVEFLTTCFDLERVDFLASLGLQCIKVASPDCGSVRLLECLMARFPRLIISTGMTPEEEVMRAIDVTRGHDVVFLHCTSIYPTPSEQMNLRRMDWLASKGVRVGSSDHSLGTDAGFIAIARRAEYLEKHFTLSRNLPGKDQAMSTEQQEFRRLAEFRDIVAVMDGVPNPAISAEEQRLRGIYIGKWGDNR